MHPTSRHHDLRGILFMLAAVATFAFMDAVMKSLTAYYPPLQVSFLRGATALPFVLVAIGLAGAWRGVVRVRWPLQLLRGVLAIVMLGCFVFGIERLTLANAYTLFFIGPLLITALSRPLLGEHVSAAQWIAIVIGLAGVLLVLRPDTGAFLSLGSLAILGAASAYALTAIVTRILGRTDSAASMNLWFTVVLTLGAGTLALPGWRGLEVAHWPLFLALGMLGALGQFLVTEAFRRGRAATVAPFEYTAILWAIGLDFALWSALPGLPVLTGASVIILSGVYLMRREARDPEHQVLLQDPDLPMARPDSGLATDVAEGAGIRNSGLGTRDSSD
ncbi:MAG TPA: DMT family transporter [Xanthomonadaceae bacterium]|nr:DMT family transporter [Xanthomonadaceae bacterium]